MNFFARTVCNIGCLFFVLVFVGMPRKAYANQKSAASPVGIYRSIAQENLKSLAEIDIEQDGGDALNALINDDKEFYDILQDAFKRQLNPKMHEKRRMVFALLDSYEEKNPQTISPVLDQQSYQDLEMLCGPKSSPLTYLAAQVDRTSTEIGRIMLYKKIVQPTDDYKRLEKQQKTVQALLSNKKLFHALEEMFDQLRLPENITLSFWLEDDVFQSVLQHAMIRLPFRKSSETLQDLESVLNQDEILLEINDKLGLGQELAGYAITAVGCVALPLYGFSVLLGNTYVPALKKFNDSLGLGGMALFSLPGVFAYLYSLYNTNSVVKDFAAGVNSGFNLARAPSGIKQRVVLNVCLQKKLMYLATYLNNMQDIARSIKQDAELARLLPSLPVLGFETCSEEIQQLLELLATDTFKGEASFFSYTGRILAAYNLMNKYKGAFIEAMLAIGELDANMSIARLYKEFEDKRVTFCFPTFCSDRSRGPAIKASNFWNPCIKGGADTAIPNSLSLGRLYGVRPSCVVTGPNAGGKSTTMKGLIIAVILAQSLGIAPASFLELTLFNKIVTYLNITDDIAAGNSHFMAGVLRARYLINVVDELLDDQFALIAVDEVFNGTTFAEGQAAAYALIEHLGCNLRTVCITPTHFPLLTQLEEKTAFFANAKVSVGADEQGKCVYPYILERGISDQIVTFKILKEQGFGDTFLTRSQQLLGEA